MRRGLAGGRGHAGEEARRHFCPLPRTCWSYKANLLNEISNRFAFLPLANLLEIEIPMKRPLAGPPPPRASAPPLPAAAAATMGNCMGLCVDAPDYAGGRDMMGNHWALSKNGEVAAAPHPGSPSSTLRMGEAIGKDP